MRVEIDVDRLRAALIDYYGSAAFVDSPYAFGDVIAIDDMSGAQLCAFAEREGFDLEPYVVGPAGGSSSGEEGFWL